MFKKINSNDAPAPVGAYSQALSYQNIVFLSGQIPLSPVTNKIESEDVTDQTNQIFKNISAVLKADGLTLKNIIKCTVFLTDIQDFEKVNNVYMKWFDNHAPARSAISVCALPKNAKVEIEAIAIK